MSETQEEYEKRQLKRRARAIQKETGMKYTEALRQAKAEVEAEVAEDEG
jgi:hypothetical protein